MLIKKSTKLQENQDAPAQAASDQEVGLFS